MKHRFSDEQIIGIIKEYEAGVKLSRISRGNCLLIHNGYPVRVLLSGKHGAVHTDSIWSSLWTPKPASIPKSTMSMDSSITTGANRWGPAAAYVFQRWH